MLGSRILESFPTDGNTRQQAQIYLYQNFRASEFGENLTPDKMPDTTCTVVFEEKYPETAKHYNSVEPETCK